MCLQGIWNKAAELLTTEGAIVPAPGCDNGAKFVLSYQGKKPHLVILKKSDMFACDSDCLNWKGLGICAHSVAVAEPEGKLSNFVEKVLKAKKTPMISKFAEATMPKGRGRKGERRIESEKPQLLWTSGCLILLLLNRTVHHHRFFRVLLHLLILHL